MSYCVLNGMTGEREVEKAASLAEDRRTVSGLSSPAGTVFPALFTAYWGPV